VIRRIGVVVPARDEEELIGECLRSIGEAAGHVLPAVDVVVVADRCRDRTAEIARELGAAVIVTEQGNVGAARAAGTAAAIVAGADWLAHTDADSIVPRDWLSVQLRAADAGADVVVGTVRPRFADLAPQQIRAWRATHSHGESLGHVHGANLGVRTEAYERAGGFEPLVEHEDVELVERLRAFASIVASDAAEVTTSGRRWGRTTGGYARYLRDDLLRLAEGTAPDLAG